MDNHQDIKCVLGMHKFEIKETIDMKDNRGDIVGKIYVSVCTNCGKIKNTNIKTIGGI